MCEYFVSLPLIVLQTSLRSLYGRLYLRDFNELDHELTLRYVYCSDAAIACVAMAATNQGCQDSY